MSFLKRVFGAEPPTSVKATTAIAKVEAELRDVPARIARARAALELVADMTDDQHAAADAELAAATRSEARLTAQIEQLRAVHARALKDEAAEALAARAESAQRRVDIEGPKLLADYEKLAPRLAKIAAALDEIGAEVNSVNYAIRVAPRDASNEFQIPRVLGIAERFLTEPDIVKPTEVVEEVQWGYLDKNDRWQPISVFAERDGKSMPTVAGAEQRTKRTTIPGKTIKGRTLPVPTAALRLPAARPGAPDFR